MDELPRDAKTLLDLAPDAHDPPDRMAHARVHARLMSAIAAPSSNGTPAAAPPGWGAWLSSPKIMLATAALALTSGGLWALGMQADTEARARAMSAPVASQPIELGKVTQAAVPEVQPLSVPTVTARPHRASRSHAPSSSSVAHGHAVPEGEGNLSAETVLLARASAQLSRNEIAAALESIEQHRRRFGAGAQLVQERDGLRVLAHCLDDRASARSQAQRYIAGAPRSVLVPRLEVACGL